MIEKFWNFIRNENNNDLLVETIKENKEVLLEQKNAEIKEKKRKQ